jgi:hypothetical protein
MPAYYEITIKSRRINDPYDTIMLDIVKATIFYDLSEVFGIEVTEALWNGYSAGSLSSKWQAQSRAIEKQITNFNTTIKALG